MTKLHSTAQAAHSLRCIAALSHRATFIATLAAASVVFAQSTTAPAVAPPIAQVTPTDGQDVGETFTVQFQDTDILQALQMLSMQGRRNIIASKGVSGTLSANLFDVTLAEALDVLLRANDFRMEESGNFIYIFTREEWDALVQTRMKKVSRNFPLEHLNAKDASEFITPILSEAGKVSFVGDVEKGFQPSSSDGGTDSWAFQGMLVVSDFPENLAAVEKLLKEIDAPPAQVIVESTIVSSKIDQKDGFGVDVSIIGNLDFSSLTNPLAGANDLFGGVVDKGANTASAVNTAVAGWDRNSTLRAGIVSDDVAVFLRMLDEVTDTTVLARPRVMALNRQRAQILIGRRVGYLTSTTTQTSTTQTVEFLDSGIKLIFRPFISADGSIRMELAPSLTDAKIVTAAGPGGVEQSVPNEDTSEVVTNVRVKSGQTLVLGGLFKEDTKIERRQVPGLGDVPIIGNAFKGYDDEFKREEIIFLVTPTIVKDDIAKVWSNEAEQFASAVRIGSREGLLPWSRETLTTAQNQQALDALSKGDTELALFHTDNSLRLSHNQPEMVRMREELRNGATAANADYQRSMMQRMIEDQLPTDPAGEAPAVAPEAVAPAVAPEAAPEAAAPAVAAPVAAATPVEAGACAITPTANTGLALAMSSPMSSVANNALTLSAATTPSMEFSAAPRTSNTDAWFAWNTQAFIASAFENASEHFAAVSETDAD